MVCAGLVLLPIAQSSLTYIAKGVLVSMFAIGEIRDTITKAPFDFVNENVDTLATSWAASFRWLACLCVGQVPAGDEKYCKFASP